MLTCEHPSVLVYVCQSLCSQMTPDTVCILHLRGGTGSASPTDLPAQLQALDNRLLQSLQGIASSAGLTSRFRPPVFLASLVDLQGAHDAVVAGFRCAHGLLRHDEMEAVSQRSLTILPVTQSIAAGRKFHTYLCS